VFCLTITVQTKMQKLIEQLKNDGTNVKAMHRLPRCRKQSFVLSHADWYRASDKQWRQPFMVDQTLTDHEVVH
jgi:hypothetical protein